MTRDEVLALCPELDNVEITTSRGTWRVQVVDADDVELPGASGANVMIAYAGPESGRFRLHLGREHVTGKYIKQVFHDIFGLDPLPKGLEFL